MPFADGFPTPSGRFEFASERAEREGHGRVPTYRPPAEAGVVVGGSRPGVGDRPVYDLVAAASDHHVNSVFAGTEVVRSRAEAPPLRVNPGDAAGHGLRDGDAVDVGNERGRFRAVVRIDDGVGPGTVATDKGWWGMGVNATVREVDSDMGRGAVFHDNRVWLEPVPAD